jgi:hypothetical protein
LCFLQLLSYHRVYNCRLPGCECTETGLTSADIDVIEAQERGDWSAYEEALRELMRAAKIVVQRRAA